MPSWKTNDNYIKQRLLRRVIPARLQDVGKMAPERLFHNIKNNLRRNRVFQLQLGVIFLTISLYIFFLIYQRTIFQIAFLKTQLILINIFLAIGLIVEIAYLGWKIYKDKSDSQTSQVSVNKNNK